MMRKNVVPPNRLLYLPPPICMMIKGNREIIGPIENGNPIFRKFVNHELGTSREWYKRCFNKYEKNMAQTWMHFKEMDFKKVEDAQ